MPLLLAAGDFSDVSDSLVRENCLGFVEQIRAGKPASVMKMVMKSRGLSDALIERVIKAAGGASTGGSSSGGGALGAELKKAAGVTPASSSSSSQEKEKKRKEKKEKKKESSAAAASASSSPPAPTPVAPAAPPAAPPSDALVLASSSSDKKKKKKKDKEREKEKEKDGAAATSPSSAVSASSANGSDRLTSIESLSSGKVRKAKHASTPSSAEFAQKHLGAAPPSQAAPTTAQASARRSQNITLKAYDDDGVDVYEKMYAQPKKPKEKDGCIIC